MELKKRNVHISSSQVAYLAQKFVIYLSILHQQSASLLKSQIIEKGGYILHVDGIDQAKRNNAKIAIFDSELTNPKGFWKNR
jgi:hypothetical protein